MGGPRAWALLWALLLRGGAAWSLGGAPFSGRRNWCSYVVTRTVSCHVQNGTFLQRVLQSCPWPMTCPGSGYRTVVRPTYKVMYKMVTAREWRCCPGHAGASCEEVAGLSGFVEPGWSSTPVRRMALRPTAFTGCLNCSKVSELTERLKVLEAKVPRAPQGALARLELWEPLERGALQAPQDLQALLAPRHPLGLLIRGSLSMTPCCPTPSLRPAATGPRDLLALQAPQDPWVLRAPLGLWASLGVLDTRDPQAPLDPKESLATQERRVRKGFVGNLAPKAPWGNRENLAPKETLVGRATGTRGVGGRPPWRHGHPWPPAGQEGRTCRQLQDRGPQEPQGERLRVAAPLPTPGPAA
ncbi:EMI domain-containing protein 1 isoform X11 [Erinaceus europaeus]|uniref:EMI domain-containing protein 1 isoform X11 n=1 Tax=Erinaceus europaeus TaxID=9365 RepID=A0ABM3XJ82_ERIEU|nr:EMI domain-containing protein 1 isoform X11 [Erinaceus europaeus]